MRTQREVHATTLEIGEAKVRMTRVGKMRLVILAVAAGAYISLGALLSIVIGLGMPELSANNPGVQRLLSGLTFPIGLFLIVILGGELFTGNNALMVPGLVTKRYGIGDVILNWTLVWTFNFIGALAFIGIFVVGGEMLQTGPWDTAVASIATAKVSMGWWTVFFKALGANWCVCLAVWLALTGKTLLEKALGCWLPVMAFVALGFEHCIANMFFIPAGMIAGADVTVGQMFVANLIPATLGNILGGALLVGTLSAWLHSDREK